MTGHAPQLAVKLFSAVASKWFLPCLSLARIATLVPSSYQQKLHRDKATAVLLASISNIMSPFQLYNTHGISVLACRSVFNDWLVLRKALRSVLFQLWAAVRKG